MTKNIKYHDKFIKVFIISNQNLFTLFNILTILMIVNKWYNFYI